MTSKQLADDLRAVYFGGNWTGVSLQKHLQDIPKQQATTKLSDCNSIATLAYHLHYYVRQVSPVLRGEALRGSDADSFITPDFTVGDTWSDFLEAMWSEARQFAQQIEQLDDNLLGTDMDDSKYGSYYRNLQGIIAHAHYHLGQIVLLKKLQG